MSLENFQPQRIKKYNCVTLVAHNEQKSFLFYQAPHLNGEGRATMIELITISSETLNEALQISTVRLIGLS